MSKIARKRKVIKNNIGELHYCGNIVSKIGKCYFECKTRKLKILAFRYNTRLISKIWPYRLYITEIEFDLKKETSEQILQIRKGVCKNIKTILKENCVSKIAVSEKYFLLYKTKSKMYE